MESWKWIVIAAAVAAGGWMLFGAGTPRAPWDDPLEMDSSELEAVVQQELEETNTPGAAVLVVRGNEIVFAKGFGIANVETGEPVNAEMLFRIGSTTKMFTAAALVSMAEDGEIDLNQPIGTYVDGLSVDLSGVTSHQLLTHTAGLIDGAAPYGLHDDSALAEDVRSWTDDCLFTESGVVFSYANPGYAAAGLVIESVAGQFYADEMQQQVFGPLAMTRSTFRPTVAMTYPVSQGHHAQGDGAVSVVRPFADNAGDWPSGFLFSNVFDLARFAIAFMNGGMLDGVQVLAQAVIERLATPYVDVHSGIAGAHYGHGLAIHEDRGVRIVGHNGAIDGFGCLFSMAPEHGVAVIILANQTGIMLKQTADKAFELLLALDPVAETEGESPVPMTTEEMTLYVGTYAQHPADRLEIAVVEDQLVWRQGGGEFLIDKIGEELFSICVPGMPNGLPFSFVVGDDGAVTYLHCQRRAFKKIEEGA